MTSTTVFIGKLTAIGEYCLDINRDLDYHLSAVPCDIDRFDYTAFMRSTNAISKALSKQLTKIAVCCQQENLPRDAISLVEGYLDFLKKFVALISSFPAFLGKTCRKFLQRRCSSILLQSYEMCSTLIEYYENTASSQGLPSNALSCIGLVIESCEKIASDPTNNCDAVVFQFEEILGLKDDVVEELDDLISLGPFQIQNHNNTETSTEDGHHQSGAADETSPSVDGNCDPDLLAERENDLYDEIYKQMMEPEVPLTPSELVIACKVKSLISMGCMLIRKISLRIVKEGCSLNRREDLSFLDDLVDQTIDVSAIVDDLGYSCHSPQDLFAIAQYTRRYSQALNNVQDFAKSRAAPKHLEWFERWTREFSNKVSEVLDHVPVR